MDEFPRTTVEDLSLSRMIIGTNWFFGWSHTSAAKDKCIKDSLNTTGKIADIIDVYRMYIRIIGNDFASFSHL